MQDLRQRPLFICGHHRSGTSLLLALLDGHPELIVGVGESRFFKHFLPRAAGSNDAEKMAVARKVLLNKWYPENNYYQTFLSHISHRAVQRAYTGLMASGANSPADYLTNAVLAYASVTGQIHEQKKYWVDKTPGTELYTRFIFDWWGQPRCIHMLRDPRDVYASFKRRAIKWKRRIPAVASIAYRWKKSEELLRLNSDTYGANLYMRVRYEDLVQKIDSTLVQVARFLGVEDHSVMRQPMRGLKSWRGNSIEKDLTGITNSKVGSWRRYLEHNEVAQLETMLYDAMCRQGYMPELNPSWKDKMRMLPLRAANVYRGLRGERQYTQLLKAYDVPGKHFTNYPLNQ